MTDAVPEPGPTPEKGATRVVNGELREFNGSEWVPYEFLPPAGTGGDGKLLVIYKSIGDYEVDG